MCVGVKGGVGVVVSEAVPVEVNEKVGVSEGDGGWVGDEVKVPVGVAG